MGLASIRSGVCIENDRGRRKRKYRTTVRREGDIDIRRARTKYTTRECENDNRDNSTMQKEERKGMFTPALQMCRYQRREIDSSNDGK